MYADYLKAIGWKGYLRVIGMFYLNFLPSVYVVTESW